MRNRRGTGEGDHVHPIKVLRQPLTQAGRRDGAIQLEHVNASPGGAQPVGEDVSGAGGSRHQDSRPRRHRRGQRIGQVLGDKAAGHQGRTEATIAQPGCRLRADRRNLYMCRENATRGLQLGEQPVDAVRAGEHRPLVPIERREPLGLHLDRLDGNNRAGDGGGPLGFKSPRETLRLIVRARHHDPQSGERSARRARSQEPSRALALEPRRNLADHLGVVDAPRPRPKHLPSPIAKDDGLQNELVTGDAGVRAYRRQAAASEAAKEEALGPDGTAGINVVDARRQLRSLTAFDRLDGEGSLTRRRQHHLEGQHLMGLAQPAEPLEPGRGQDQGIDAALRQPS